MSDVIEQELREAFAARVEPVAPRIVDRVSSVDFHQRRARVRLFAKLGAAGGVVTAGAVAAVLVFASGAPEAFAGWTAIPARVSEASLSSARKACGITASVRVLAAESRGPFVSLVFVRHNDPWQCITRGSTALMKTTTEYPARLYEPLPPDKITTPSLALQAYTAYAKWEIAMLKQREQRLIRRHDIAPISNLDNRIYAINTGSGAVISVTGTAGRGVTAVRFVLADGKTVSATVQGGWYEAWWPGSATPGAADAERVELTTSAGSVSTKMTYDPFPDIGVKHCARGAACSVFAPIVLRPGIAPALRSHFAIFRNPKPVDVTSMSTTVRRMVTSPLRMEAEQSYGIDRRLTRAIVFPGQTVELIMPGTEGLCESFIRRELGFTVGSGGCEDVQSVLRWGEFSVSGSSGPTGLYTLHGLVPNGNRSVTVNLVSGAKLVVPVHDNIVYANFSTAARSVTFRNAFGNIKHHPA